MSEFHLRIASAQKTDIVYAKIEALGEFYDDDAKLDLAVFDNLLSDPITQLRIILA